MAKIRTSLLALVTAAVVAGSVVTPIAAQADDAFAARISGHVTAPGAVLDLVLYDATGTPVDEAGADASGYYWFDVTTSGSYTVSASDYRESGAYFTRFFPNVVSDVPSAPGITFFTVDKDTPNVDLTLANIPFSASSVSITGSKLFGKTLTADTGDWPEAPDFEFQWFRNGFPIADATDEEYVITEADLGENLTVLAVATADGYETTTVQASVAIAAAPGSIKAAKPTITGVAKVGKKLKAVHGTWAPRGIKFTYQWYVGKKAIAKATKSTFKITKTYKGKTLRVAVTGGKVGVGAVQAFSKTTKKVKK